MFVPATVPRGGRHSRRAVDRLAVASRERPPCRKNSLPLGDDSTRTTTEGRMEGSKAREGEPFPLLHLVIYIICQSVCYAHHSSENHGSQVSQMIMVSGPRSSAHPATQGGVI